MIRGITFSFLMLTKIFSVIYRKLLQAGSMLQRFHGLSDWENHSISWLRQLSSGPEDQTGKGVIIHSFMVRSQESNYTENQF